MGILSRMFGRSVSTDTEVRAFDPFFDWRFTDWGMRAHTYVPSSDLVLSNLAVAARCVQLRSEMLASVPMFLYRRGADGGRTRAEDNPLYTVLHDIANPNQSA